MGATNITDRVAASLGLLTAVAPEFHPVIDVHNAGVIFALPALLASGLLDHSDDFLSLSKGYYGLDSILMLLAFMALARIKSIEKLRFSMPGEWGKLLGLDRIPEVRTLRQKINRLSEGEGAKLWGEALCRHWMAEAPESAGVLYIDGHVRVYNGSQTKLPRHHVARQKLCLHATTDYWINAMDSQPFFVINKAVDPGMIKVIEQDILPRLESDIPQQPSQQELSDDPWLHRFTLIFDREGYSPAFFKDMREKRIACLTYHKFPSENWPEAEFELREVTLSNGEQVEMQLAERGTCLTNKMWVREIRKLSLRGHQTSILCTDYKSVIEPVAMSMFARWGQENYFKYMREQFGLDRLSSYSTADISDPTIVVNPKHRALDGQVRSHIGKLNRRLAEFGEVSLNDTIEPEKIDLYVKKKVALQEDIEYLQEKISHLKQERKAAKRHITMEELPEADKFQQLCVKNKYLIDNIKMIAYRAETSMANILRNSGIASDEARGLLQAIYTRDADLIPDQKNNTLIVCLHHMANKRTDNAILKLCDELNATETHFPRTNLKLIFKLGSK